MQMTQPLALQTLQEGLQQQQDPRRTARRCWQPTKQPSQPSQAQQQPAQQPQQPCRPPPAAGSTTVLTQVTQLRSDSAHTASQLPPVHAHCCRQAVTHYSPQRPSLALQPQAACCAAVELPTSGPATAPWCWTQPSSWAAPSQHRAARQAQQCLQTTHLPVAAARTRQPGRQASPARPRAAGRRQPQVC